MARTFEVRKERRENQKNELVADLVLLFFDLNFV